MRWLLGLGLASLAASRPADACTIIIDPFVVGPMVETTPPGTVEIGTVRVDRADPDDATSSCRANTAIRIGVSASDDTTPASQLGYRTRLVSGTVTFATTDQLFDRKGPTLAIVTAGVEADLDFELGISAIDSSGNVGPETVIPIHSDAPGCNAVDCWSLLPGLSIFGLLRRRKPYLRPWMRESP